ncbi:MAG TPA: nicotinate-nucleotide adenylyltransferase [Longimicrobiales bacterium]
MNVGILGGTFDPPHIGHLIVAQDAALVLGLDRVLFIPAAVPPHKQHVDISAAPLRARMLELAIGEDPQFGMDTLEIEREGASFTVETLRALTAREPRTRWTLLMGADQYVEFETWRDPEEIRRLARLAVMTRGGRRGGTADSKAATRIGEFDRDLHDPATVVLPHGDIRLEVTRIDISATAIRRRVAAGLPIRYLVPAAVEELIFEQKLYVRNGTGVTG